MSKINYEAVAFIELNADAQDQIIELEQEYFAAVIDYEIDDDKDQHIDYNNLSLEIFNSDRDLFYKHVDMTLTEYFNRKQVEASK